MNIRFPAMLEIEDGNIVEYGYAELAPDPNSVNFIGAFIPLCRIGEEVSVVRIMNERRFETLRGKVFLSSRNLLQVTEIDDASMAGIRGIFLSNTKFHAQPYMTSEKKRFLIRPQKTVYRTDAIVYYISASEIRFLSMDPLARGRELVLDLDEPFQAKGIRLSVRRAVDFGNIMNAYICDITSVPQGSGKALHDYIASLSEAPGD